MSAWTKGGGSSGGPATSAYLWTWLNAAARLAQGVTAEQVGLVGFQSDIALEYKLMSASPVRWAQLPDAQMGPAHVVLGGAGLSGMSALGSNILNVIGGTLGARAGAATTLATALQRASFVTGAVAGNGAYMRSGGGVACFIGSQGWRWHAAVVLGAVSASMRWFVGASDAASAADADPRTFQNSFGFGTLDASANVQFIANANMGTTTNVVDLGVSFPARSLSSGYVLDLYSYDGTSIAYQIRNIVSGAEFSGASVSPASMPAAATLCAHSYYVNNHLDAAAVSLDPAEIVIQQRKL